MSDDKIVITGAGVISPIGVGLDAFEKALYAGESGVGPSQLLDSSAITAEVRDFAPQQWLGSKGIRVLDRTARLLCVAAQMALASSGLEAEDSAQPSTEFGLVCGTMFGSIHSITGFDWSGLEDGPNLVNPMDFPNTVINSAAGQAAIKFKLGGINTIICAGAASGLHALQYAAEFLQMGRARMLLAGGAEELSEEAYRGFKKNEAVSSSGAVRPFHAERDGTIIGEGSALLVMESASMAAKRSVQPWAEIAGFGSVQDTSAINGFDIRGDGASSAVKMALESGGIRADQIGCILSAASGSRAGDEMEAHALKNVFGTALRKIPVCAPKAALGESLGAAGAMAALIGALALRKQCLPPTSGADVRVDGLRLSSRSQPVNGEFALINAFSCDGNNAALVLRRWSD
jgi:3-oxoacyl-[acyl-carrier-protein] synthase II